ncbi:hypothetical protein EV696_10995 [Permianibacter aggregans]|uniref:Uncharacterized protein n=2 Tax=Permianibacter aggregans TaxID=1510150 RepID=A0A4R6ULD7_9GAMM|nr:hypothetical protein EV696_10995 [Permianibacter aggregans]
MVASFLSGGCAVSNRDSVRLAFGQIEPDSQMHSVSVKKVDGKYSVVTESFLGCAPECRPGSIDAHQFSLWAALSTEKYQFDFFVEKGLLNHLPERRDIESEVQATIDLMVSEFESIFLVKKGGKVLFYLVEEGRRKALRWEFKDSGNIVVAFAFPLISQAKLEGRVNELMDLTSKRGVGVSQKTLALSLVHAELVKIFEALAHEWTHVDQDLNAAAPRETAEHVKERVINDEVRAYLVGFYIRALLANMVTIDLEQRTKLSYSLPLPKAIFPSESLEVELRLPVSAFNLNEYVSIQQTIAGANIAACLGKEELTNDMGDLNRLRQLVLAAVQSDHDFTKGFLLPENACRTEAAVLTRVESSPSVH